MLRKPQAPRAGRREPESGDFASKISEDTATIARNMRIIMVASVVASVVLSACAIGASVSLVPSVFSTVTSIESLVKEHQGSLLSIVDHSQNITKVLTEHMPDLLSTIQQLHELLSGFDDR